MSISKSRRISPSIGVKTPQDVSPVNKVFDPALVDKISESASYGQSSTTKRPLSESINLDAWIGPDDNLYPLNQIVDIDPSWIASTYEGNYREYPGNINTLTESILTTGGNTQPVKIRVLPDNTLQLVTGTRRTKAVKIAKSSTNDHISYRALLQFMDDKQASIEALVENLDREDLSLWELAKQLQNLLKTGAVSAVSELVSYLPKKRNGQTLHRQSVYDYLLPNSLKPELFNLIDKEAPVTIFMIRKLHNITKDIDSSKIKHIVDSIIESGTSPKSLNVSSASKIILKTLGTVDVVSSSTQRYVDKETGNLVAQVTRHKSGNVTLKLNNSLPDELIKSISDQIDAYMKSIT